MTGRILIVDDVATNRIVMKVKLGTACYTVEQASGGAEALHMALTAPPDLILLDVVMPDLDGLEVCRTLKANPGTAGIPIILVTAHSDRNTRMAGLKAGADDVLAKPVDEDTLLARVRSLLRTQNAQRELDARGSLGASLGFADAASPYDPQDPPGQMALISGGSKGALIWKTALDDHFRGTVSILPRDSALMQFGGPDEDRAPDVFVLSADLSDRDEGLRLLSELKSRPGTRHAAMIVVVPTGDTARAAMALDLGADDILYEPLDSEEMAIRLNRQLNRKRQADKLRACIDTGLELATTDALTGLYNRRYGIWQLDKMLSEDGRGVAVMMLDLDHFKAVNDRYGHAAGDRVLRLAARRLRSQLRPQDLIARIGGEEFLVALPDTTHAAALTCAERLRRVVGERPFRLRDTDQGLRVTLSAGLTHHRQSSAPKTAEELLAAADAALYGAKSHGRDQVTCARQPVAQARTARQ